MLICLLIGYDKSHSVLLLHTFTPISHFTVLYCTVLYCTVLYCIIYTLYNSLLYHAASKQSMLLCVEMLYSVYYSKYSMIAIQYS
ncbi:hypothetical protein ETTORE_0419 [Pseudomonas phage Ettore]|nr:hypothetical protein ETTORE_0419 [Pseudomonas phage Ettore]